jgi:hypothetical protein
MFPEFTMLRFLLDRGLIMAPRECQDEISEPTLMQGGNSPFIIM